MNNNFNDEFKQMMKNYDGIVFFDTETTGFDAEGQDELGQQIQVIELAATRLEIDNEGTVAVKGGMDEFIRLPEGNILPPRIVEFNKMHETGISDSFLKQNGKDEQLVCKDFEYLAQGNVLLVAYNAQFDLCMVREMLKRSGTDKDLIDRNDVLDPLTMFKDIKPYDYNGLEGHRLEIALEYFDVADQFKNSHRAIDDCKALIEITRQLYTDESSDKWINLVGYNPKYGLSGRLHPKVEYFEQAYF